MGKSSASDAFDLYFKLVATDEKKTYLADPDITQLPLPNEFSLPSKGRIRYENLTNYLPLMQKGNAAMMLIIKML